MKKLTQWVSNPKKKVILLLLMMFVSACKVNTDNVSKLYMTVWREQQTQYFAVHETELTLEQLAKTKHELTKENIAAVIDKYANLKFLVIQSNESILPHLAMREVHQTMSDPLSVQLLGKEEGEWGNDDLHLITIKANEVELSLADILTQDPQTYSPNITSTEMNDIVKEQPNIFMYYQGLQDKWMQAQEKLLLYETELKMLELQAIQKEVMEYINHYQFDKTTIKVWTPQSVYIRTPMFDHEIDLLKKMMFSAIPANEADAYKKGSTKHTITDGIRRIIVYSVGLYGHVAEIPELNLYMKFQDDDYIQRLEAYLFYPDYTNPIPDNMNFERVTSVKEYFEKSQPVIVEPMLFQMNVGAPFSKYDPHIYYDFTNDEYRTTFFLKEEFDLATVSYRWNNRIASFKQCLFNDVTKEYAGECSKAEKSAIQKLMSKFLFDVHYRMDQDVFLKEIEAYKKSLQ